MCVGSSGLLDVTETWWHLPIDVTHHLGHTYLSVIDCGPSQFCVWWQLHRADGNTIVNQLEQVFYIQGALVELLSSTDTIFSGQQFAAFAAQ